MKQESSNLCQDAFEYEIDNTDIDIYEIENTNFVRFLGNFELNINKLESAKIDLKSVCIDNYDRYWKGSIGTKPKADSFNKFKTRICLEPYLTEILNLKHKIATARLRMSNHSLMIETGIHVRQKRKLNET